MESGKDDRREIGRKGEDAACRLLEEKGHIIIERNWRYSHLEVDVISAAPDGIHFVEVKTRSRNIQAPPQENVDRQKQRNIAKAAQAYLRSRKGLPYRNMECMFDIVAVIFSADAIETEYIEQAYIPMYL